MNHPAKALMTVEEFLSWADERPDEKWELADGVPIAMAPERIRHSEAKGATYRALGDAISRSGLPGRVWVDGPCVKTGKRFCRIPDVIVQCSKSDADSMLADQPVIIVEVISPSSRRIDTSDKLDEYFNLESTRHYLLVKPEKRVVIHHRRDDEGELHTRIVTSGDIVFNPPGLTVACEDLLGPAA